MTLTTVPHRFSPALPRIIEAPSSQTLPWDLRLARGIHDLLNEITQPAGLIAMGVGSAAFRAGKLFAQWGLFSGAGWGARLGTSLFGLGTEAVAFTETGHAYAKIFGNGSEITPEQRLRQYGETALLFGSLRAAGFASLTLGHWAHGRNLLNSPTLRGLYQQGGMYCGILLGHGLLEGFNSPGEALRQSLADLVKFNAGGWLARRTVGRFLEPAERLMEQGARKLEIQHGLARTMALAVPAGPSIPDNHWNALGMQSVYSKEFMSSLLPSFRKVVTPVMGLASGRRGRAFADHSPTVRLAQEGKIEELLPSGQVMASQVAKEEWVKEFLDAHEISTHYLDIKMFRSGFYLGKSHPELARRMAWDVDEVQLHWSLNPVDIFRGIFRGESDAPFQNTPATLFNYAPFKTSSELIKPWHHRLWYDKIQRYAPSRMRQTIQFHPAGRAFLLGMQSSAFRPLNLITTGPAGRLLILINEDPALKRIYFDKLPTETVTIEEIRSAKNIYTREDLVKALRILAEGETDLLKDPLVQDYIKKIRENSDQAHKLKHPALAKILQKNSFDILVDESASTYQMLVDVPGLTILKPASARPDLTLNLVLGSRRLYLDRMANGYFEELARVLDTENGSRSREISAGNLPHDYPLQRFTIEVPWARFRDEFALPGFELDHLAAKIRGRSLPAPEKSPTDGFDANGIYLKEPGRRVAVLGDVGGARAYKVAKQGHYPIFIDVDRHAIGIAQRTFRRFNRQDIQQGDINRQVLAQWIEGDWYDVKAQAHAVEAFYPHTNAPFIGMKDVFVTKFVQDFMDNALHSKLRLEGGSVYLVTELQSFAKKILELVQKDPSLELVEANLYGPPPIQGGYDILNLYPKGVSWVLYLKKPR